MKNTKNILIIGIVTLTLIFSFTLNQSSLAQEKKVIIGTWVLEGEPNQKSVFTSDGILKEYIDNKLTDTYKWSISTTSPQCGKVVTTGDKFSYLSITNVNDANDKYCYEIFSLDNQDLQIRLFGRSTILSYKKQ